MSHRRSMHMLLAGAIALALAGTGAAQTTWYVDDDGCPLPGSGTEVDPFCSIQYAILASSDGDEIIVRPGTYEESLNLLGRAVWLHSSDGAATTTIDGLGVALHVVVCNGGEQADTIFEGFTITGGNANGTTGHDGDGGGMYVISSPTIVDCILSANSAASFGGGMYVADNATITGCSFIGNSAGDVGGGLCIDDGSPAVIQCGFDGNTATSWGGGLAVFTGTSLVANCTFDNNIAGRGGGMYNTDPAAPTVQSCTFWNNQADLGGGMYNSNSSPVVTSTWFEANSTTPGSEHYGGGVANNAGSSPEFTDCSFVWNTAISGAGMANMASSPTLTGCIFRNNTATEYGGGLYGLRLPPPASTPSNPILTDCDFIGNTAQYGAGMANGDQLNWKGSDPTLLRCLFYDNASSSTGGGLWTSGSLNGTLTDCLFVGNSAGEGGALFTQWPDSRLALADCDFISNTAAYGGAVKHNDITNDHFYDCRFIGNYASIRGGAITDYDARIYLHDCLLENNHTAGAGGAIFNVYYSELTGCTFNGNHAGSSGGAIFLESSTSTVTDCVFTDNRSSSWGGAIRKDGNWYGELTVSGSTFTDNWANRGGAIASSEADSIVTTSVFDHNEASTEGGAVYEGHEGSGTLTDVTFHSNHAGNTGGGLFAGHGVDLTRCTFTENVAQAHGGGVFLDDGGSTLLDCDFSENTAWQNGGGLHNSNAYAELTNCTFHANDAWNYGGGVSSLGTADFMNVLLTENLARLGGGLYCSDDGDIVNSTFAGNIAWENGTGVYSAGSPFIKNSVLWDMNLHSVGEIAVAVGATITVEYSAVFNGWAGPGNTWHDPQFVDPAAGDYRLSRGSPCIDAGNNVAVPPDSGDLDDDGNTAELCPIDLVWGERFVDDPYSPDVGVGTPPIVDMGAFEFIPARCAADLTGPTGQPDDNVDALDFLMFVAQWGSPCVGTCEADITSATPFVPDGNVDSLDYLLLIGQWGSPGNCPTP